MKSKWQWQWQVVGLVLVLGLGGVGRGAAQIKLRVVEDPKVGKDAPDITAAYLTADGPGPVDQPFHLNAELGHTVVLVFSGAKDSTTLSTQWQSLAAIRDSVFRPGTVVVGVLRQKAQPAGALAAGLRLPFKLLPDSLGRAFQSYGVVGRQSRERLAVFVVDPLGKLAYRSRDFSTSESEEVRRLREALK
jgi:peroxiredoxin